MNKYLYDIFQERWVKPGGSIWIYSDPHFNDPEMKYLRKNYIGDEEQIKRINSKVGKNDTIIFLGDVGDVECVKRLKAGYKVLIMGNHDKGASNYKRDYEKVEITQDDINHQLPGVEILEKEVDNHLFDEVYEGPLWIAPKILLSHEPIKLPYVFNFHGHDHSFMEIEKILKYYDADMNNKELLKAYIDTIIKEKLTNMNFCAEHIDYTPINLNYLIKSGILAGVDDIHRETIDKAIERKLKKTSK